MAKVVGVCGAIGAGKGEVSARLAEALGLPEYAYAQGLKTIVASVGTGEYPESREVKETEQRFSCSVAGIFHGITKVFPDMPHAWHVEKAQVLLKLLQGLPEFRWVRLQEGVAFTVKTSYRTLYQLVGTEWGRRHIGENVWIQRRPKECVVNDVRAFEKASDPYAEAKAIIADGGVVLRVVRPEAEANDRSNGHESEFPMADEYIFCDVDNSGTLDDLDEECDRIAEMLIEHFAPKPKVKDETAAKTKGSRMRRNATEPKVSNSESGDSE